MNEKLKEELLALDKQAWEANKKRDVEFYDKLLDENSIAVTPFGILDKKKVLKDIASNPRELLDYQIENPHLLIINERSAILTYKANIQTLYENKKSNFLAFITTIYINIDGNWRAIFYQQTVQL
ncbi:MAG: nuclear transport factor 2 family protein [Candidatus Hermodarchaeota archaeon]